MSVATELDQVAEELRQAERLLLIAHENPDGDALGSLLAMHEILRALGKDSLMFMPERDFGLPHEYRGMAFDLRVTAPPADVAERLIVFLDCGNIDRMPVDFAQREGVRILNIDHHHDNTRFGTVDLVVPDASSTAEIVYSLAKELGVELTPRIAEALYVGLVTDTGRFMYESTTPGAHRMAAELIEAGVDVHGVYRTLYEELPFRRLQLMSRALARVERYDDGSLILTHLTRADFDETGSTDTDSEGVIDRIRSVEGTVVAALVRELTCNESGRQRRKVSLRATDGRVDVSRIARGHGGGGHPQAAGFTTECDLQSLVESVRAEIRAQLGSR
jgi:bifunctional oligoribonuclease and PAP phosphatase NrnA